MPRLAKISYLLLLAPACLTTHVFAQTKPLSWQEVRDKFEAANPTLRAAQVGIDEARAQEITAYLRPNPDMTTTLDQIAPFSRSTYRPLRSVLPLISFSYLR